MYVHTHTECVSETRLAVSFLVPPNNTHTFWSCQAQQCSSPYSNQCLSLLTVFGKGAIMPISREAGNAVCLTDRTGTSRSWAHGNRLIYIHTHTHTLAPWQARSMYAHTYGASGEGVKKLFMHCSNCMPTVYPLMCVCVCVCVCVCACARVTCVCM